jgi:hypothetical protein
MPVERVAAAGAAPASPAVREAAPTRTQLLDFARKVVECGLEGNDADGGDIQEWAVQAGLLIPTTVTEECNPDNCSCAEGGFPTTCYRYCAALTAEGER